LLGNSSIFRCPYIAGLLAELSVEGWVVEVDSGPGAVFDFHVGEEGDSFAASD
jgi:hypothetical protein